MFLSRFWFEPQSAHYGESHALRGKTVTIVDAEDDFSNMLKRMIAHMGAHGARGGLSPTTVEDDADLLIGGPGPRRPDLADRRQDGAHARGHPASGCESGRPLFAVCLSHQILCHALGMPVHQQAGTFPGRPGDDRPVRRAGAGGLLQYLHRHGGTGAGRYGTGVRRRTRARCTPCAGAGVYSVQFHPESILTSRGYDLTRQILCSLLVAA